MIVSIIANILLFGFASFLLYKNVKGKVLVATLKEEVTKTHNHYAAKYDYYINFKDRYHGALDEIQGLKELLITFQKPSEDFKPLEEKLEKSIVIKPKKVRKAKAKVE